MHPSWTLEARTVLDHACASHGGDAVFRAVRSVSLVPRQVGGLVPSIKGLRRTFPLPRRLDVFPHERCTVLVDYPEQGLDGVFDNGHVWIRERDTDRVLAESDDHRQSFAGLAKHRRWTPLDALYVLGYATWHHLTLPFTLREAAFVGLRSTGGSRPLTVIDVEFAEDVPTHSRRQAFHFDWAGRLRRHDYRAEVIGRWAYAAHLWSDYRRVDGLAVAMERRVVPRVPGGTLPLTLLHEIFADASVVADGAPGP